MKSQVAEALIEEYAKRARADVEYVDRLRNDPLRWQQMVVLEAVRQNPGIKREQLVDLLEIDALDLSMALRVLGSSREIKYVYDDSQGVDGYYAWNAAPSISIAEKQSRYEKSMKRQV